MTKLSFLAAIATVTMASSAGASVITVGGGYAHGCFEAADGQDVRPQALDVCDRALTEQALTPSDQAATLVNRGILHLRRISLERADADFDAALAIDPALADAWLNKAILNVRYGRSAAALPLVNKALQLNTRQPALAYFVRAVAYEDSGNIAAAYQDLQRARRLAPNWGEPIVELKRFKVRQL
jgi:tetratricopeptide (TPR) repeat protein